MKALFIRIGNEDIETWPERCVNGYNCQQCYLEGKIRCAPRFWINIPRTIGGELARIKMFSLKGKKPMEIAEELELSLNAVYSARQRLRKKGVNVPRFTKEFPPSLLLGKEGRNSRPSLG